MSTLRIPMFSLLAGTVPLAACTPGSWKAPFAPGLQLEIEDSRFVETRSYIHVEGQAMVEGDAFTGAGSTLEAASRIASTTSRDTAELRRITSEVIGTTAWDHILLPGEDNPWHDVKLSVLAETHVTSFQSDSLIRSWNPTTGEQSSVHTVSDDGQVTSAGYYGMAARDYLIKIESLDLWNTDQWNRPGNDPTVDWDEDEDWTRPGDAPRQTVRLVTRMSPRKGDVWTSLNGRSLYVHDGTERMNFAETSGKTDRVAAYTIGSIDTIDDVLDTCVLPQVRKVEASGAGTESSTVLVARLDPGCSRDFTHQETGTQWWHDGLPVKSEMTRVDVTITDHGYQWYEEIEGGGGWVRQVSATNSNRGDARRFVMYDVSIVTSEQQIVRIED